MKNVLVSVRLKYDTISYRYDTVSDLLMSSVAKKKRVGKKPRIDERVERSKRVVLEATYKLLAAAGLSGVSVDEVSRRSGVAKTTIYRHWPTRESLLLDACSRLVAWLPVPDTGAIRTDLEALACEVVGRLHQPSATAMPSVIDAAERDDELAKLHSRIHAQMCAAFFSVIERAQERGELARSQDARELVASILGPILYRRFFSRERLDEAFARKVVERALRRPA
jgi:AcrR family transcriptional regulator